MKRFGRSKLTVFRGMAKITTTVGAVGVGAVAVGAFAVGALAIGALAIRRLAIRGVLIGDAEFGSLKIRDLTVDRLHAGEVMVSDSLKLPGGKQDAQIS